MSDLLQGGPYRERLPARDEDQEARMILGQELEPGEQLIWAGRPVQGVRLVPGDALTIPFSLLWGGFAIVWEVIAIVSGAPWFFKLWGIPFVVVGFYIMVGRFFVDARRRARTFYGVTTRRAILVEGRSSRRVVSIDLGRQEPIELREERDGRGTITFGAGPSRHAVPSWPGTRGRLAPSFESVHDARAVYQHVLAAQRELQPAGANAWLPR